MTAVEIAVVPMSSELVACSKCGDLAVAMVVSVVTLVDGVPQDASDLETLVECDSGCA